jgi:hypothetical protein
VSTFGVQYRTATQATVHRGSCSRILVLTLNCARGPGDSGSWAKVLGTEIHRRPQRYSAKHACTFYILKPTLDLAAYADEVLSAHRIEQDGILLAHETAQE